MGHLLKGTPVPCRGAASSVSSSTKDVLALTPKAWRVQRDLQNASAQGHTSRYSHHICQDLRFSNQVCDLSIID